MTRPVCGDAENYTEQGERQASSTFILRVNDPVEERQSRRQGWSATTMTSS